MPTPRQVIGALVEGNSIHSVARMSSVSRNTIIAAISLHFMYYNFVRIHQSLRVTPAMAAGVTGRVWEISDIVRLLERKTGKIQLRRYALRVGVEALGT